MGEGKDPLEGFYSFQETEDSGLTYLFVKERQQLGGSGNIVMSRHRAKQYIVWRADEGTSKNAVVRNAYSGHEISTDPRYERINDDPKSLAAVETGWTKMYESTSKGRIIYEPLLTG